MADSETNKFVGIQNFVKTNNFLECDILQNMNSHIVLLSPQTQLSCST